MIAFLAQELLQTQGCCSLLAPMSCTENQLKAVREKKKKNKQKRKPQQGTQGPSMSYLPSRILTLKFCQLLLFYKCLQWFFNILFIFCSSFLLQVSPMPAIPCWGLFLFGLFCQQQLLNFNFYVHVYMCVNIYTHIKLVYICDVQIICTYIFAILASMFRWYGIIDFWMLI